MRVFFGSTVILLTALAIVSCASTSAAVPVTPMVATATPSAVVTAPATSDTPAASTPTAVETPTIEPTMTTETAMSTAVASPTPTQAKPPPTATTAPAKSTATPASEPATGPRTVTLADAGTSIDLKVGDSFLLALGETWDWNVAVNDPSIVSRQVNILVVRGAQGVYNAHKPGQTILRATGDPLCRQSNSPLRFSVAAGRNDD
jgi:hypothetical protein